RHTLTGRIFLCTRSCSPASGSTPVFSSKKKLFLVRSRRSLRRFVSWPLLREDRLEVGFGLRVAGRDFEGLAEGGDGAGSIPFLAEGSPEAVMHRGNLRGQFGGPAVGSDGPVQVPRVPQGGA